MEGQVRARLRELVEQYGPDLAEDPRRVRALLNDALPSHRREVSSLVAAADEGIASDLRRQIGSSPDETLLAQLTQRLVRDHAMDSDAARWAVISWAEALGLRLGPIVVPTRADEPMSTISTAIPPQAPTPANPPGRRRLTWALAGGGVLLALLATTRIIGLPGPTSTPFPSAGNSVVPSTPPPSSPPPSASSSSTTGEFGLLEYIPAAIRDSCLGRTEDPLLGSVDELVCEADGVDSVVYVRYATTEDMYAEYDPLAAESAPDGAGTGDCPTDIPSEDGWVYDDDPDTSAGRYLCFLDTDGKAWLAWTADSSRIYAWASRADGDMESVHDVWARDLGPDRP